MELPFPWCPILAHVQHGTDSESTAFPAPGEVRRHPGRRGGTAEGGERDKSGFFPAQFSLVTPTTAFNMMRTPKAISNAGRVTKRTSHGFSQSSSSGGNGTKEGGVHPIRKVGVGRSAGSTQANSELLRAELHPDTGKSQNFSMRGCLFVVLFVLCDISPEQPPNGKSRSQRGLGRAESCCVDWP